MAVEAPLAAPQTGPGQRSALSSLSFLYGSLTRPTDRPLDSLCVRWRSLPLSFLRIDRTPIYLCAHRPPSTSSSSSSSSGLVHRTCLWRPEASVRQSARPFVRPSGQSAEQKNARMSLPSERPTDRPTDRAREKERKGRRRDARRERERQKRIHPPFLAVGPFFPSW